MFKSCYLSGNIIVYILLLGKCYLESQTRPEEFTRKVIKTEKVKKPKKQVIKNK
jgi:hypothetical protein